MEESRLGRTLLRRMNGALRGLDEENEDEAGKRGLGAMHTVGKALTNRVKRDDL